MSKRGWIIFSVVVLTAAIGFVVATYFIYAGRQKNQPNSPENKASSSTPLAVPTEAQSSEQVYEDSSGFSFKYPPELTVSDQTPDDNKHYSLLYIKNQSGETTRIRVKDVAYSSSDQWSSTEKEVPAGTEASKSSTLSGLKADYYETPVKLTTLAIAQNILYEIVSPNTAYWQKVHQRVVESFTIGAALAGSQQSSSPADNTTYEAEEIVE